MNAVSSFIVRIKFNCSFIPDKNKNDFITSCTLYNTIRWASLDHVGSTVNNVIMSVEPSFLVWPLVGYIYGKYNLTGDNLSKYGQVLMLPLFVTLHKNVCQINKI